MKEEKLKYKLNQNESNANITGVININNTNLIPREFTPLKNK